MDNPFFRRSILNSPYEYPLRHWEFDESSQPTNRILDSRRRVSFISPIPKPRKPRGGAWGQARLVFDEPTRGISRGRQQYDLTVIIYISGFKRESPNGSNALVNGRRKLFGNCEDDGTPFGRLHTNPLSDG